MAEAKTKPANLDKAAYIAALPALRQPEADRLLHLFSDVTGYAPRIWAGRMVGFGRYEYRYQTGHSGQALATGFAIGRAEISIYIMPGYADYGHILEGIGKHRLGKSCLYLRALTPQAEPALRALIREGLDDLAKLWPVYPA